MDIQAAIQLLRVKHLHADASGATIEDMAEACKIDVAAPFSYREILDLAESLAISPHVVKLYLNGERRYFAARRVAQPASAPLVGTINAPGGTVVAYGANYGTIKL